MPTKKNGAKVPQRDKIKQDIEIKELPWTEKQQEFIKLALDKQVKLIFVKGPAGSAKTLLSVFCGLKLIADKKVSDIIYIRSAVESSDAHIGFLPGDIDQKLSFYNLPLYDKLEELLSPSNIEVLYKQERVSTFPINFCRGMNWNAKCIIIDESQNSSLKEIITVLTRLGKYSKCFVLADPTQTDLKEKSSGGFERLSSLFDSEAAREQGIYTFELNKEDIMRSDLVKFIVTEMEKLNNK